MNGTMRKVTFGSCKAVFERNAFIPQFVHSVHLDSGSNYFLRIAN